MSLSRDLLFLIRQFCKDENLHKTAHMLEKETSFYFDMNYFEELVLSGNWSEVEAYLSSFTTPDSNEYSIKMYFEIRKQKFLEALDRQDLALALDILLKDLKCFASSNEHLYKEMAWLLTMEDFRKHHSLSTYGDIISARRRLMDEVKALLEANPHFRRKIKLPNMETTRLRRLINQSLNWQHSQCGRSECVPQINSLLFDHKLVTSEAIKDSTNAFRIFSRMPVDKVVSQTNVPVQSQNLDVNCPEDLPGKVERCMDMSSLPTSMDFHPLKGTLLLVGNINGETELWDVRSEVKFFWNAFMIWKRETISSSFLIDYNQNPQISVNRVLWSPDGSIFGVAYSKQIVQLYCYHATGNYIEKQLEIDAHLGGVHDLAFSSPYDQILVITCGEDKLIQVWDSMTGSKQYTCEGHGSPVYSLCAHLKEDIHFVFSTSTNGEIKAWMFDNDNTGPRVALDAPGHSCMRMAYSADGKRLFSCGTNEDGDSYLVEWDDTEGSITQSYHGLSKSSAAIVQFSTSRNRFLVAGDEHLLKFWEMDNVKILVSLDADGGLPAKPYVCFNKEGTLLAVFADDSKIKILANDIGTQLLQTLPSGSVDSTGRPCRSSGKDDQNMKCLGISELNNHLSTKEYAKPTQVSRCKSLRLTAEFKTNRICRLLYTNAGNGILALAADGIHLFWKWPGNGYNDYGQATTNRPPCLWHPKTGSIMVNDLNNDPYQIVSPCFALSKNDSYLVSASGGMVSLFNIVNFEKVRRCLLPPPTATCMAFYPPDNNLVAIGMDDSTVLIYNVRDSELMTRLSGHLKRISGLAFSNSLKVLVSAAVDSQIIVWDTITWEKKKSISMQISVGWWLPSETSETVIQFHKDQLHFLAIHETQLAMYESRSLERIRQWNTRDFCARISSGTFSCDNQLVFVVMRDGIVMILSALDLSPRFRIDPSAYLPPSSGHHVYPVVIAAHPQKSNQFALGLSNGDVIVVEPHESEGKWTILPPFHNGPGNRIIID
nr:topless-related protein 1-like [Coffea arabica]